MYIYKIPYCSDNLKISFVSCVIIDARIHISFGIILELDCVTIIVIRVIKDIYYFCENLFILHRMKSKRSHQNFCSHRVRIENVYTS